MNNPFKFGSVVDDPFFTNRTDELAKIQDILNSSNHLIMISPRRFGKSDAQCMATSTENVLLSLWKSTALKKTTSMQVDLHNKLKAMLWDIPEPRRLEIVNKILSNPTEIFLNEDQLFIKALNTLKWYELTKLVGKQNLITLLTDTTIQKLFPVQRRTHYTNARRLLSKYAIPASR